MLYPSHIRQAEYSAGQQSGKKTKEMGSKICLLSCAAEHGQKGSTAH